MTNTVLDSPYSRVISQHSFAEVIENLLTKQHSIHSLKSFSKDELICTFSAGGVFSEPDYRTIQMDINRHITLVPGFLQYCNHSCSPNIFFNTTTMEVTALKDIKPNDEFCFFYPSTEFDMAQPFICYCGSRGCLQNIRGAKYTDYNVLAKYHLTDFIKEQLKYL